MAGILRECMASAESGSVPSGVGYGEGYPLSSRIEGLGSVVSSPAGSGAEPRPKTDFGERSFLYLHDKNLRQTICISVPCSKFWGGLVLPRNLRP